MKRYFSALAALLLTLLLTAQEQNPLKLKEEALAIPYWFTDSTAFDLLEEAYLLLQDMPASLDKAEVMACLSYANLSDSYEYSHLAEQAMDMSEALTGERYHPAVRAALITKASTASSMEERRAYVESAFERSSASDPLRYQAGAFLGSIYGELDLPEELDRLVEETAISLAQQSASFQQLYGLHLNELKMEQASTKGDFRLAIEYGKVFYEQLKEVRPNMITPAMLHCYSMTLYYQELEETELALEWAQKGLDHYGVDSLNTTLFFIHYAVGTIYKVEENYEQAIFHFERALQMLIDREDVIVENVAVVTSELSSAYRLNGDEENALRVGAIPLRYAPTVRGLYTYAFYLHQAGKLDQALEYVQQAIVLGFEDFDELDLLKNPTIDNQPISDKALIALMLKARFLTEYAVEQADQKWWLIAESSVQLALSFIQPLESTSPSIRSAELIDNKPLYFNGLGELLNTLERRYSYYQDHATLRSFLQTTERVKANNLVQSLSQPELPSAIIEESRQLEEERAALQQSLDLATNRSEEAEIRKAFLAHSAKVEAFEKRVAADYKREGEFFYNVNYSDFTDLEQKLTSEEAVLSYTFYRDDNRLYITYTDQTGTRLHVIDQPVTLAGEVQEYVQLLRSPLLKQNRKRELFTSLGHALYQKLIGPFDALVHTKKHLTIIPSQALEYLPFEALLTDESANHALDQLPYLIRTHSINYAPSATTLMQLKEKTPISDKSLLAFAPVFVEQKASSQIGDRSADFAQDTIIRSGFTKDGFSPLIHSKEEVNGILEILGNTPNQSILLEKRATADNLMAFSSKPLQFLHIATHGLASLTDPTLSALACYDGDEASLIYANEIQFMPLNVDLAVLSSCDTGVGELAQGEGVLALSRTFLYAGARNVVSSLWKVGDAQTKTFMLYFYQALQQGASYSAALRTAKLQMLENSGTSLPRFWSAFMLIGA